MAGTRKDIAKLNGLWAPELLWYAKAVGALRTRNATDRTGWLYLAAIHGINIPGWISQNLIGSAQDLPSQQEQDDIFNQCQHAGWFFPPWHRGYLAAFELILDTWIQANGGPTDWALPYWNYLDDTNPSARSMPQEFLDATLPDGTPNPLSQAPRGGTTVLGPQPWLNRDITLDAQTNWHTYTAAPGTVGYGGAISGFAHQGNLTGAMESDPHNLVHVMIGGLGATSGWMSDPDYAGLDPIFWMHHCNIDRLWEAWMSDAINFQEASNAWKNGPFPRQFLMPTPAGGGSTFTPGDTLPGGALAPNYDNLNDGTGIAPISLTAATGGPMPISPTGSGGSDATSSLVGANSSSVEVAGAKVSTSVPLVMEAPELTAGMAPQGGVASQKVFLNLEGVRGTTPSGALEVFVVVPDSDGGEPVAELVDTVVFFGLAKSTSTEGSHAGNGLSVAIDISELALKLQAGQQDALNNIEVQLSQPEGSEEPISVGRISVFTQTP